MYTVLRVKRSNVAGKVPAVADIDFGELAVNTFDGKLFIKKDNGTEQVVAVAGGSPAGSEYNVQINDGNGNFSAIPNGTAGQILATSAAGNPIWINNSYGGTVTSVNVDGGSTGFTFSGGPVSYSGTMTMSGVLSVANGGTGTTTTEGLTAAVLPSQTGNAGKVLSTNGTTASWITPTGGGSGTVTSVQASGGTTGLTFSGGPITSTGTVTLGGTLSVANGGTGTTTPAGLTAAVLPPQGTNAGKVLSTDGTTASWISPTTFVTASAGEAYQVQYRGTTAGTFAATSSFTFTPATGVLTTPTIATTTKATLNGMVSSNVVALTSTVIDATQGNYFNYTSTAASTWTIVNAPAGAFSLTLRLVNGGSFQQTWPSNIRWATGNAPTLTSGTSAYDVIFLTTMDGGTTFQASALLNFTV